MSETEAVNEATGYGICPICGAKVPLGKLAEHMKAHHPDFDTPKPASLDGNLGEYSKIRQEFAPRKGDILIVTHGRPNV